MRGEAVARAVVRDYYRREQRAALIFAAIGAFTVVAGYQLYSAEPTFSRGLGGAWLVFGMLFVVVGVSYAAMARRRGRGVAMKEIGARFRNYMGVELAIAAVGIVVASLGAMTSQATWTGAGVGVAILGLVMFGLEIVSRWRAAAYAARL